MTGQEMPGGRWPEAINLAINYLESAGMTILNRLLINDSGESGVIASDHGVFVVCEVQERAGAQHETLPRDDPLAKARKLRQIAEAWLTEHELPSGRVRVDIVAVAYEGTGGHTIERIKDAALPSRMSSQMTCSRCPVHLRIRLTPFRPVTSAQSNSGRQYRAVLCLLRNDAVPTCANQ